MTLSRIRFSLLAAIFSLTTLLSPGEAWAMKNRTIIFRSAGSGAAIGLVAGLVSYPFAKSTGTVVAGAVVGALLGTAYGYHLVEKREEAYQNASVFPLGKDAPSVSARESAVFIPVTAIAFDWF